MVCSALFLQYLRLVLGLRPTLPASDLHNAWAIILNLFNIEKKSPKRPKTL